MSSECQLCLTCQASHTSTLGAYGDMVPILPQTQDFEVLRGLQYHMYHEFLVEITLKIFEVLACSIGFLLESACAHSDLKCMFGKDKPRVALDEKKDSLDI